jgi:hypothetical protein
VITISFYSYKGGVGRSLTLTNLGVYLAQFGATVAMVDFDLEAPGLHYKIQPHEPLEVRGRGLAGLLADVSRGAALRDLDWDVAIDVSKHAETPESQANLEQPSGQLFLIPAGNPMDSGYWRDLADIDWDRLFTGKRRRGIAALAELKERLAEKYKPDVLLVDSRTGITPGGGVATTLLPDVVVTMMLNSAEHLDGSRLVVSAVAESQRPDTQPPEVVPVLSRYTSPPDKARRAARGLRTPRQMPAQLGRPEPIENIPLKDVWNSLVRDLPEAAAEKVKPPLVLHADLALQRREHLTFGPYADIESSAFGQTLLEDYLRLFAALVPKEMFLRYLTGVRSRARSTLLDNPEDAVRTLESLATLVGDEDAFVDLVKVYVLRRDTDNLLRAAERLYRLYERIVPHPALTQELRNLVSERVVRYGPEGPPVTGEFAVRYWRTVAPDDVEWGASLARFLADTEDLNRARELANELIERDDGKSISLITRIIAAGRTLSERLAVEISLRYFEVSENSPDFLSAAAQACLYRENTELAVKILGSPTAATLPAETSIRLLQLAGRYEEAGTALVDALAVSDGDSGIDPELVELWNLLLKRVPAIRTELQERNVEVLEQLDALTTRG